MVRHDYRCPQCGKTVERAHPMRENPTVFCPQCRTQMTKMVPRGTGFILKGSWPGKDIKND
jgi:putative FmdB family regulatory protein